MKHVLNKIKINTGLNNLPVIDYRLLENLQGDLKTILPSELEKLKVNIVKEFKFPFYVWKNKGKYYIEDGHQRQKALQSLEHDGYKIPKLPYQEIAFKNKKDAIIGLLELNSQYGDFNPETTIFTDFNITLPEFEELNLNLRNESINFDFQFDGEPNITKGNTDPDEIPETPKEPVIKTGDLVALGKHRMLAGDSTKKEDVERLMSGEKAEYLYTDPPYGINVVKTNTIGGGGAFGGKKNEKRGSIDGNNIIKANKYRPVKGDDTTETARKYYSLCQELEINNIIIWGGNHFTEFLPVSRGWVCWDKIDGVEGTTKNFSDIELAWTSFDVPARIVRHRWQGLLKASEHNEKRCHPTQKPIALAVECFSLYKYGNLVYDGFLGSGSTLIACETTDRTCRGIEIDPGYVQVSAQRWIDFTGRPEDVTVERGEKVISWGELNKA